MLTTVLPEPVFLNRNDDKGDYISPVCTVAVYTCCPIVLNRNLVLFRSQKWPSLNKLYGYLDVTAGNFSE